MFYREITLTPIKRARERRVQMLRTSLISPGTREIRVRVISRKSAAKKTLTLILLARLMSDAEKLSGRAYSQRVQLPLLVKFASAGPCALWHGQSGQVGNEAATVISHKCRRPGSPTSFQLMRAPHIRPATAPASPHCIHSHRAGRRPSQHRAVHRHGRTRSRHSGGHLFRAIA
jgi:hypothetical protein